MFAFSVKISEYKRGLKSQIYNQNKTNQHRLQMKSFANIAFSAAALLVADAYALGSCTTSQGIEFRITANDDGVSTDLLVTGTADLTFYSGYSINISDTGETSPCSLDSATSVTTIANFFSNRQESLSFEELEDLGPSGVVEGLGLFLVNEDTEELE